MEYPDSFYRPMEGRRLSRPWRLLHTEMVYPPIDGHPSGFRKTRVFLKKAQPGWVLLGFSDEQCQMTVCQIYMEAEND